MMNFGFITPLILCSICWVSVSASDFYTVTGRPGEEVTLLVSNISKYESLTYWFRMLNRTSVNCVSVMIKSESAADFCDGFSGDNFEMRSNVTNLFLRIKRVALSDSGLYFCVFYTSGRAFFSVVHLHVEGSDGGFGAITEEDHDTTTATTTATTLNVILGGLTSFLLIIICLGVKFTQPLAGGSEEAQQRKNLDSGNPKVYSATIRNRRSASEREVETRVIYSASK